MHESTSPGGRHALPVTPDQQRVLVRIGEQRARILQRKAARLASQVREESLSGSKAGQSMGDAPVIAKAVTFARAHPVAVALVVALGVAAGPRRLIRWAGVVLPLLSSLRS